MKPGFKTTEFWVTMVAQLLGILATAGVFTPEQAGALIEVVSRLGGLVVMAAGAFGYSISRGKAKASEFSIQAARPSIYPGDQAGCVRFGAMVAILSICLIYALAGCGAIKIDDDTLGGVVTDEYLLEEAADTAGYSAGLIVGKLKNPALEENIAKYWTDLRAGRLDAATASMALQFLNKDPILQLLGRKITRLAARFGAVIADDIVVKMPILDDKYLDIAEEAYILGLAYAKSYY